ncbi:platelet endothelial cell adhesion molecule isoform X2 [Sparus aurata]|uniref:platelet endothelial cell adhesion molecule isoform X2 n=1 Tax=Sparus aurata TaxID=8175 RepID=UPI0011C14282|nr:platelet endothelial cell adhesion molecule-like isoform X2 [Sparus aurata]
MDSRPPNLPLLLLLLTSLLHLWQSASGQSSYIIDAVGLAILPGSTVQRGTPVTISCKVTVIHDNISNLTHTFQLKQDDYVIHSSTTTEDSFVYELNPARAADSGNYECRVTVKEKSRSSFSQKLDVTGLQTPILYLDNTSPYENDEFTANCSAPDEKGPLTFSFYQRSRTGAPQKIKQPASTGNWSETTLVLREVKDSFLYCDYEINLVSGARRSNRSSEIQVIVKALHIAPVMNVLPNSTVYEGEILEVVCRVINPLKNIEVFLTTDRRILKQAKVALSHQFTAQEGDSGELVCKAVWGSVQKETYQTITVRELFSKPRLTVNPIDIFEGDRLTLACSVPSYARDKIDINSMRFSIYRDNVKVTDQKTFITEAHPSKNGNYTCKVHVASLRQNFVKESQKVVVKAKVPVSKPVLSVVGGTLVLGKPFQLLCHSDSGTLPIMYTLFSPNRVVESMEVSHPGQQAIFNTSAVNKRSDVDTFLCHARNSPQGTTVTETGQLLRSTKIIEPVSKPVLSILPSMGDVSEGQDVTLVCSVRRGTLPIIFTWYHTETEGAILTFKTFEKMESSYKISNVRGNHQGQYYCVCTNPAKGTEKSATVTIRVKLAGWKKGLIAAFCILLILGLILVLAFTRRLLRFKRKTGELKSVSTKAERLSLTQAEVNMAANVTPGIMGKSVWSEHVSGSESDDQNSVTSPDKAEPQYTEVQIRQADPNKALVKKGTDTVYSEVRNSKQGAPVPADGGSVEYAQLNHDADHHGDHGYHGDHSTQDDHIDEIDSRVDNNTVTMENENMTQSQTVD